MKSISIECIERKMSLLELHSYPSNHNYTLLLNILTSLPMLYILVSVSYMLLANVSKLG